MKRWILIVFAAAVCISLAACGAEKAEKTIPAEEELLILPEEIGQTEAAVSGEAAAQTVEITLENWQQYFTLKTAAEPVIGENGKTESWDFFYGVFLKPEYQDRFVSGQVNFEIRFDTEHRKAVMDGMTGACTLGELVSEGLESDLRQKTCAIEDFRGRKELPAGSDFQDMIAAQAYTGSVRKAENGALIADIPGNGSILHAEGTLTLQP